MMLTLRAELIANGGVPVSWPNGGILGGELPCLMMLMNQHMSGRIAARKLRAAVVAAGEADNWPDVMKALRSTKFPTHPVPLNEDWFSVSFGHYLEHVGAWEKA